jgi:hypothetical protein
MVVERLGAATSTSKASVSYKEAGASLFWEVIATPGSGVVLQSFADAWTSILVLPVYLASEGGRSIRAAN